MTASRDPERLLTAYFADGPTELAHDSYEAVDEAIQRTRQRTAIGPWRTRSMLNPARAVLGAAALLIAAVVGWSMFGPAPSTGPGGIRSASPSPSASVTSSGSPGSSGPPAYRWPAALEAGTYTTSFVWDPSLQFTFTVPAGWQSLDINVAKNDRISLVFFPIDDVAAPTCASPAPSSPDIWTADTVLAALDKLVDFDAPAVDATVGGRSARYVEFTAKGPVGCANAGNVLFRTPTPICQPAVCGSVGPPTFGLEFGDVTHHERLWLVNVGRQVVAISAVWTDGATPAELAELESIVDSVQLDTPFATPPPQPAGSGG